MDLARLLHGIIFALNDLCMQQATFYRTLAKWNIIYHKLENSPHPNAYVQCGKRPLPQLLERIPDAKDQIVAFGVKSLATLTIEGVLDLIVSTVFPRLAIQRKKGTCYCISHDKQQGAAAMTSSETVNENIKNHFLNSSTEVNELFNHMAFDAFTWLCVRRSTEKLLC